jgi:hypothetical protein
MAYQIELHTDRPIVQTTLGLKLEPRDIAGSIAEVKACLDELDHQVYYLVDATVVQLDLGDILTGVSASARGADPLLHHPKIIETIVVTDNSLFAMAARSLDTPTFGNLHLKIFPMLDEALGYIDVQLALTDGQARPGPQ